MTKSSAKLLNCKLSLLRQRFVDDGPVGYEPSDHHIRRSSFSISLSADIEAGFGSTIDQLTETVRGVIDAGAVG